MCIQSVYHTYTGLYTSRQIFYEMHLMFFYILLLSSQCTFKHDCNTNTLVHIRKYLESPISTVFNSHTNSRENLALHAMHLHVHVQVAHYFIPAPLSSHSVLSLSLVIT